MPRRSSTQYVQRNKRLGGWEVVSAGQKRASAYADTRDDAVKRARAIVRRAGGGEIRIKDRVGKIVESRTVRGAPWRRPRS